jgi:hypothetical protein
MIVWGNVDPELLDPAFRMDVEAVLGELPSRWKVTQGRRSTAYQADLWAKYQEGGPRAAPPGMSPHEFGLAIDVVLDDDATTSKIEPNYRVTDSRWLALFDAIWKHPRLHSGRSFQDADHIEALGWKNMPRVHRPQPLGAA